MFEHLSCMLLLLVISALSWIYGKETGINQTLKETFSPETRISITKKGRNWKAEKN